MTPASYSEPLAPLFELADDAPAPVREAAADLRRVLDERATVFGERQDREADLYRAADEDRADTVAAILRGDAPAPGTREAVVVSDLDRMARTLDAYDVAADESLSRFLYQARQHVPAWRAQVAADRAAEREALAYSVEVARAEIASAVARVDELDGLDALLVEVGQGFAPQERTYLRGSTRRPVLAVEAAALPSDRADGVRILDPDLVLSALARYPEPPSVRFASEDYALKFVGPNDYASAATAASYDPDDLSSYDMAGALAAIDDLDEA